MDQKHLINCPVDLFLSSYFYLFSLNLVSAKIGPEITP